MLVLYDVAHPRGHGVGHDSVVVVVAIVLGQHPPGQPTVVVDRKMHRGRMQPPVGCGQGLGNTVEVMVAHGAGPVVVKKVTEVTVLLLRC